MIKGTKLEIVFGFRKRYRKACKKEKGQILGTLVSVTGYSRKHLMEVLSSQFHKKKRIKRERVSKYLPIFNSLKEIWKISNFASGQRFQPMIGIYIDSLERHHEINLSEEEKTLLLTISSATIDRLLKKERRKLNGKGKAGTKPGTLLKNQIPIRTWMDWNNKTPGFLEIDTVHNCGSSLNGNYVHTLDTTDVATSWNECVAFLGGNERFTIKALEEIKTRIPFPILGIDFDSGAEFVNWYLVKYCDKNKIIYTRSREGYKNDQAYIEQQNFSVVRRFVGYKRLDTWEELANVNQLYLKLSDYQNFFQSVMRLKSKERDGAHMKRIYFKATTAYQKVMEHPKISEKTKDKLKEKFLSLSPKKLLEEIEILTEKLYRI